MAAISILTAGPASAPAQSQLWAGVLAPRGTISLPYHDRHFGRTDFGDAEVWCWTDDVERILAADAPIFAETEEDFVAQLNRRLNCPEGTTRIQIREVSLHDGKGYRRFDAHVVHPEPELNGGFRWDDESVAALAAGCRDQEIIVCDRLHGASWNDAEFTQLYQRAIVHGLLLRRGPKNGRYGSTYRSFLRYDPARAARELSRGNGVPPEPRPANARRPDEDNWKHLKRTLENFISYRLGEIATERFARYFEPRDPRRLNVSCGDGFGGYSVTELERLIVVARRVDGGRDGYREWGSGQTDSYDYSFARAVLALEPALHLLTKKRKLTGGYDDYKVLEEQAYGAFLTKEIAGIKAARKRRAAREVREQKAATSEAAQPTETSAFPEPVPISNEEI